MQDWIVVAVAAALALVVLVLAVALLRARSRAERVVADARAETAALRARLDDLERLLSRSPMADRRPVEAEFVITGLGGREGEAAADRRPEIDRALFADLVLRETVVKAASLAHGLRRALDPETRNRIRFEMKREVRRARKQRRADLRQARREWEARQRAGLDEEGSAA